MRMRAKVAAVAAATLSMISVASVGAAPAASAASSTLSVTIPMDGPTIGGHFDDSSSCYFHAVGPRKYSVYRLNVSVAGSYVYEDLYQPDDITVAAYPVGGFDPANPGANCISSGDDDATLDLSSATSYTLVVAEFGNSGTGAGAFSLAGPGVASLEAVVSAEEHPRVIWYQAVGRGSAEATCPEGYTPGWAEWPNEGAGGWVCNRALYAYGDGTPPQ